MTKLNRFELSELDIYDFYFIAHLFDRVLLGKNNEPPYHELVKALCEDRVLEAHFFNKDKEIYASRINHQLVAYKPLFHLKEEDKDVVTRSYKIEGNKSDRYNTLTVKEYVGYEDHLAYVKQTILYELEKR